MTGIGHMGDLPGAIRFGTTVGSLFREQARLGPSRPALEEAGRVWTYAQLNERVNRLVHAMAARGLARGDRVAVLSENRSEYVEVMLASAKLGVLVACQNWRLADSEMQYCLALADPKLVFCSERLTPVLARIDHGVPSSVVFGDEYEAMLARADSREPPEVADPEDGLILIYTSGTTGLPKGAVLSQRAEVVRAMLQRIEPVPVSSDDNFIAWPPMFHMGGTDSTLGAMMRGAKVIVLDGFDAEQLIEIASRERIAHFGIVPGVVDRILDAFRRTGLRPLSVRTTGLMADLIPPARIAEVTTFVGAPFCNSLGSTESGWPPASKGLIPIGVVPTSLSKHQSSYCLLRLVDEDDNDVPDGEAGEIAVRAPTMFSGYWRAPEANAHAFRGGWFHPGDMLRRNPDGTLDFVDRRKYLIKSGGENIYPAEIERVLMTLPGVADVVVVRKPDVRWGEVPVAFIVRDPGAALTQEQAIAACRSQIATYKVPKEVRFIEETDLRRSSSGKIIRGDLEVMLGRETSGADAPAPAAGR